METNSSFKEHKQYMLRFNNEGDLYSWQDAMSESCCMGVSQPWNFRHNVHVGWDPVLHKYTGLPDEWSKKLPAPDTHPSLGVLRRKLVRFLLPEEGITFTINVERCARGIEVLETVLKKFGKGGNHNMGGQLDVRETDTGGLSIDGWGIYLDLNQEDGRGEALSEAELMSVCHAPLNHPVREHALTLGRTNLGKRCGSSSPSRKNFDKLEPPSETSLFPPQDSISIRPPPAAGVPADVESEDIFVCISINDVSGSPGHVSTTLRLTEDTRMQDVLERVCWKAKLDRTRYGNKAARYGLVVGGDSSLEPLAMDSTVADLQGARQLLLVTLDNSST
ncbi:hypothetical protein C8R43DRAFT_1124322 [Mycena crocata]|nr:hypothetical protein C8R43DRAFT_1124322 [Mycena crocata]